MADDRRSGWSELRSRFLQLVLPAGLVTGLLYVYGWQYTRDFYRQMGVDTEALDLSSTDYILRSVDTVVTPLPIFVAWLVAVAAFAALVVRALRSAAAVARGRVRHAVPGVAIAAGMLAPIVVAVGDRVQDRLFTMFCLAVAAAGLYVLVDGAPSDDAELRLLTNFAVAVLGVTFVWSLFSVTLAYAQVRGVRAAVDLASERGLRPEVVVYSRQPLGLEMSGAWVDALPLAGVEDADGADAVLYRYSGVLMVTEAAGQYVLWSCEEQLLVDGVVVLPAGDPTVWFETVPIRGADAGGEEVPCAGPFRSLLVHHESGDAAAFLQGVEALDDYARRSTTRVNVDFARAVAAELAGREPDAEVIGALARARCAPELWARVVRPVRQLVDAEFPGLVEAC